MNVVKNRFLCALFGLFVMFNLCFTAFAFSEVYEVAVKEEQVASETNLGIPFYIYLGDNHFEEVVILDCLANYIKEYIWKNNIKVPDRGGRYDVLSVDSFKEYEIMYDKDAGAWCSMFLIPLNKKDSDGEDVDYINFNDDDAAGSFDDFDDVDFTFDKSGEKKKKYISKTRNKLISDLQAFYSCNIRNCKDFNKHLKEGNGRDEFERYLKERKRVVKKKGNFYKKIISYIKKAHERSIRYNSVDAKRNCFLNLMKYLNKKDLRYSYGFDKDEGGGVDYLPNLVEFLCNCNEKKKKLVGSFNNIRKIAEKKCFNVNKFTNFYKVLLDYYNTKLAAYGQILRYINNIMYGSVIRCFEKLNFSADVRLIEIETKNVCKRRKCVNVS